MSDPSWSWSDDRNNAFGGYSQNWQHLQGQRNDAFHRQQLQRNVAAAHPTVNSATDYYNEQRVADSASPSVDYYSQGYWAQQPVSGPQSPHDRGGVPAFSQQLLSDPMLTAARQIGGQFAEQQKERLTKYLSAFQVKYYFDVNNSYVGKKLGVILFPFIHRDWTVKYDSSDSPVPPRVDINAPDLYIPLMAFVTYVLISGFLLGTQGRFTPEQLGIITTNAMAYLLFENLIILFTRYVMNISKSLTFWHSLAYSSYKFVGMDVCLLAFIFGGNRFYLCVLAYISFSVVFFLLRTVKTFVLDVQSIYNESGGRKRKIYLLLYIAFTQPFLMWWLTSGVTSYFPGKMDFAQLALTGIGLSEAARKGQVPVLPNGDVDYEALLKMP